MAVNMKISKKGLIELANYEGMSIKPYLDSGGVKTVGIGLTISNIKDLPKWSWDKELPIEEGVKLYQKALEERYEAAVRKGLTRVPTQYQYDVFVSLCYNIGPNGFLGSTALRRFNQGSSDDTVCAAINMWTKDNGRVVRGLVNRRAKECALFKTGKYNYTDSVHLIEVNSKRQPIYTGKMINILAYIK